VLRTRARDGSRRRHVRAAAEGRAGRRRRALLHTAPLGVAYLAWYVAIGRDRKYVPPSVSASLRDTASFVRVGVSKTFASLGQFQLAGFALAALLVVGLGLALFSDGPRRARLAAPVALLVGCILFWSSTAHQRAGRWGPEYASSSRYLYISAALVLPAIAVAADAVMRRWSVVAPAVLAILLVGLPGNVFEFRDRRRDELTATAHYKRMILAIASSPLAREVPRDEHPEMREAKLLTVGWLLDGVASGHIPKFRNPAPSLASEAALRVSLEQQVRRPHPVGCDRIAVPANIALQSDDIMTIGGGPLTVVNTYRNARSSPVVYLPSDGSDLHVRRGPLDLELAATNPAVPVNVCVARGANAYERAIRDALRKRAEHG
jgi:hypothetical protein